MKTNITKVIKANAYLPFLPPDLLTNKYKDANQIMAAAITTKIDEGNLKKLEA